MAQLAMNRILEITRWEKFEDLNRSRVGGIERRMLERCAGHSEPAVEPQSQVPKRHQVKGCCTGQG